MRGSQLLFEKGVRCTSGHGRFAFRVAALFSLFCTQLKVSIHFATQPKGCPTLVERVSAVMRGTVLVHQSGTLSASAVFSIMETIDGEKIYSHCLRSKQRRQTAYADSPSEKAKWLLKNGKAKVIRRSPFTIQLTTDLSD